MLDKDFDSKFMVKTLFTQTYNAFDKHYELCSTIKKIPSNIKIKIILATKGGSLVASEKIAKTLKQHPSVYDVYICSECYSNLSINR